MLLKPSTALLVAAALTGVATAQTPESAILLKLLVAKGLITEQEASAVLTEIGQAASTEASPAAPAAIAVKKVEPVPMAKVADTPVLTAGKSSSLLQKLTFSNRIQAQFAHLSTDVSQTDLDPADINHFFLRRVYFGVKADLGEGWTGSVVYDFAGPSFDEALVQWKHSDALIVQAGLRKAPIAYEEFQTSSGSLKAIERSAATRYFVEPNNGRRLGAGGYHQGVFVSGKQGKISYMGAVTNPERQEDADEVGGIGNSTNNTFGYWGYLGYGDSYSQGDYSAGLSLGFLPDQGGKTLGAGDDLLVVGAYGDVSVGKFRLSGELFLGENDNGAGAGRDANPRGYWIQPSYRINGLYELVFRYSHVDSDGRGVSLGDGLRSAPSGGTMDTLDEYFLGGSVYFRGDTLKLQAGYVYGETKDLLDGTPAKATAQGLRSQLQVSF